MLRSHLSMQSFLYVFDLCFMTLSLWRLKDTLHNEEWAILYIHSVHSASLVVAYDSSREQCDLGTTLTQTINTYVNGLKLVLVILHCSKPT